MIDRLTTVVHKYSTQLYYTEQLRLLPTVCNRTVMYLYVLCCLIYSLVASFAKPIQSDEILSITHSVSPINFGLIQSQVLIHRLLASSINPDNTNKKEPLRLHIPCPMLVPLDNDTSAFATLTTPPFLASPPIHSPHPVTVTVPQSFTLSQRLSLCHHAPLSLTTPHLLTLRPQLYLLKVCLRLHPLFARSKPPSQPI